MGADSDRKGEADLHTGGVVFELLVLEGGELGKVPDVVVHGFHLVIAEAEEGAVHVDVFAAGEFGIKADAELDEGDEGAVDDDVALFGVIDAGKDFE